jgi:hypothetical protein
MTAVTEPQTETQTHTAVMVLYNGQVAEFKFHTHERVSALLEQALDRFHIVAERQLMALFNAAGAELPGGSTVGEAGVRPGDELVLRQTVVKGG